MTASSMGLQKVMHFFGQFSPDSVRGGNLLDACFTEATDGSKSPQQQIFAVLAYTGAIIENAFFYAFFHE